MAYDRWNSTYGSPPSGVSREQAASEDAARRFARRRALLMGLQGGLGAGVEAGGGFLRNLTRGLAGSLGGTLQAGQMQHEEERQSIRDQAEAQRDEEARRRWEATFGLQRRGVELQEQREARLAAEEPEGPNVGATPWYEALPDDDPRKALYRTDATRPPLGAAGGGPTAMQRNVDFLIKMGYDPEDALIMVQRMVPTVTSGFDVFGPTGSTRTPQVPKPKVGPKASHDKPNPLLKYAR